MTSCTYFTPEKTTRNSKIQTSADHWCNSASVSEHVKVTARQTAQLFYFGGSASLVRKFMFCSLLSSPLLCFR